MGKIRTTSTQSSFVSLRDIQSPMPSRREPPPYSNANPQLPAEAALSFLKDTKGTLTWSTRDLADTLKINRREAEHALALLQAQGYVQAAQKGSAHANQWITTPAGETISAAKPPRFTRESVEQALTALKDRITKNNKDPQAPFRITEATAFGDFLLTDRARLQSADVGIGLARREHSPQRKSAAAAPVQPRSASDAQAERKFLRDLRARSAHLNLRPYANWMRQRTHRSLL
jgi:DNA-binding transcriptional MocR family regulator